MRVRVLVTDGNRTVDLYWVSHDGKDVYCGIPKTGSKRSYYESGKIHSSIRGDRSAEVWHTPLQNLMGQFHLTTVNIGNAKSWIKAQHERHEYSGKKSDAVLIVDARVIPNEVQTNVAIGLLEPGNFDSLNPFIEVVSAKQVLLCTSVQPWVYVALFWFKDIQEIGTKQDSFRKKFQQKPVD